MKKKPLESLLIKYQISVSYTPLAENKWAAGGVAISGDGYTNFIPRSLLVFGRTPRESVAKAIRRIKMMKVPSNNRKSVDVPNFTPKEIKKFKKEGRITFSRQRAE